MKKLSIQLGGLIIAGGLAMSMDQPGASPASGNMLKPKTLRQFEKIPGCGALQMCEVRS